MANYQYVETTGLIVPTTQDLRDDVVDEYKEAFGNDLITTPDTPQGVLITSETLARAAVVANNAAVANQINPNISEGIWLDAICALTGLQRASATATTVVCELTGTPGTIVPTSVVVADAAGNQFSPVDTITLSIGGMGSGLFQALIEGSLNIPPNTVTLIINGVLGLSTVNNPLAGTPGINEQSDLALRNIRNLSLSAQNVALPTSAISNLFAADIGVTSVNAYENYTDATITTPDGSVTLVPHSMWYCVDGGSNTDIATILLACKSAGAAWNGAVTVNITQPVTGQVYIVKFDRPTYVPILVNITVSLSSSFTGDPVAATKQAILNYASGQIPNENGLVIGAAVSPFELAGAVNIQYPGLFVTICNIKKASGGSFEPTTIPILIGERATIVDGSIVVTVT